MRTNEFRGTKFDSKLTTAEIAKCIRADIKAAVAAGELPKGIKTSVRIETGSMYSAIRVNVVAFPGQLVADAWALAYLRDGECPHGHWSPTKHTPAAAAALATLQGITNAYNRDNSDSSVDYFDRRFYDHVGVDHDLDHAAERATTADVRPAVLRGLLAGCREALEAVAARGEETTDAARMALEALEDGRPADAREHLAGAGLEYARALGFVQSALRLALRAGDAERLHEVADAVRGARGALEGAWSALGEPGDAARARARAHLDTAADAALASLPAAA
jgi:hypothetical protein